MSGSGNNRLKTIFDREVSRIYATDTDAEQRHNALPHIVSVITTTIISWLVVKLLARLPEESRYGNTQGKWSNCCRNLVKVVEKFNLGHSDTTLVPIHFNS